MNALLLAGALLQVGGGELAGRVVRVADGDTLAVPAATVLLHRVSAAAQGVVDSVRSDARGRWRFRPDPAAEGVLLVSARHHGIEYFAPPVAPEMLREGVAGLVVEVADLDATAPVSVAARHLIVGGPAPDGTRDVVDLVVLRNATGRTRAFADTAVPTWSLALPPHAANVRLGDADFAAELLDLHGDTLFLHAPIPPGDRQLFLQYQVVPATRRFVVPLDQPVEALSLLAEEAALEVEGPVRRVGEETMDGRRFVRWSGSAPAAGAGLTLVLEPGARAPGWIVPALVAVFALALAGLAGARRLPRRG